MPGAHSSRHTEVLITMQEVRHLAEILPLTLDVDVYRDDKRFWIIKFCMGEKQYILSTVRGTVRRWRQLDPVLDFLCARHRTFRSIRLHLASKVPSPKQEMEGFFVLEWSPG